jgi:hypothetical protein
VLRPESRGGALSVVLLGCAPSMCMVTHTSPAACVHTLAAVAFASLKRLLLFMRCAAAGPAPGQQERHAVQAVDLELFTG